MRSAAADWGATEMARFVGQWWRSNFFNGTDGSDEIIGAGFKDILHGGYGRDTIDGAGGDDEIFGDGGDDTLFGGDGKDKISGGDDNDILDGGKGDDTLNGDAGSDRFVDFRGNNTIDGGSGRDTVDYSQYFGKLTVNLTEGTAIRETIMHEAGVNGGQYFQFDSKDTLTSIENIVGSVNDDILIGNGGTNFIQGGRGDDMLTGKGGADYFVFADADVNFGRDTITDFDVVDSIDLRNVDARIDVAGNQAFSGFVDRFTGHSGELILSVHSDFAMLIGDTDGDSNSDFYIEIRGDMSSVSLNDFML
jgi:Ca2+-binding RTX toxin-like protein